MVDIKGRLIYGISLCLLLLACTPSDDASNELITPQPSDIEAESTSTPLPPTRERDGAVEVTFVPTASPIPRVKDTPEPDAAAGLPWPSKTLYDFPNARSIDFTVTEDGRIFVAFGRGSDIYVAQSADGGRTFSPEVSASQDGGVFVFPLERPAIVRDPAGRLHVAWPGDNFPGRIWYAFSDDDGQTFSPATPLSEAGPETVLVRLALNPAGAPVAAWLQNSGLSFARTDETGQTFLPDQVVDEQTCDCCHPQPLWLNDDLLIAYRNLVFDDDGRHIRDIYLVKSADGGATFSEPLRISDAPWYISACPFSGPSMVTDGDQTLFVSWMDGRNDEEGNLSRTDIWLAISTDGGRTFSANRRINENTGVYTNLPSLAYDAAGRLHVVYEARESDRSVLYYTVSLNGGETFEPARVLVNSTDFEGSRPGNASLFVDENGLVYVSWVDRSGGYLGIWDGS